MKKNPYQIGINNVKSIVFMEKVNRIKQFFKPTRSKIIFFIIFSMLALQQRFSAHYPYISRADILAHLVKNVNSAMPKHVETLPCTYEKIIEDMITNDIPSNDTQILINTSQILSGEYIPEQCRPLFSTAILVPYRNRKLQLDQFIPYMHSFLEKQNIHYRIFIIEQIGDNPWNKGKLFNIGAKIAMELGFPCLILHDVDLLPLNPANIYACTSQPRHMSASIDKFRYNLPYETLVGGALAILNEHYIQINGYSNKFENWGGEDDELANRFQYENLEITRFPPDVSRYTMLKHKQEPINNNRFKQIKDNTGKYKTDGLTTVTCKAIKVTNHNLYTNISVYYEDIRDL